MAMQKYTRAESYEAVRKDESDAEQKKLAEKAQEPKRP